MTPKIRKNSISNEQLVNMKVDQEKGLDNPGMSEKRSASSISSPPNQNVIEMMYDPKNDRRKTERLSDSDDDYDPYKQRNVKHPTTSICNKTIRQETGYKRQYYLLPSSVVGGNLLVAPDLSLCAELSSAGGTSPCVEGRHEKTEIPGDMLPSMSRACSIIYSCLKSFIETLMHVLKATFGTGILAMADAFNNSGYVFGTICTIAIGLLCTHIVRILILSEYELCKKKKVPSMTYPETFKAAFEEGPKSCRFLSRSAPTIVRIFLLIYEMGSCSIYIVFVAKNMKEVVDFYNSPDGGLDVRYYETIFMLLLLLLNSIRNLKVLAPFATAATAVNFLSFVLIFYYLFSEIPDFSQREAVADISKMPLYFGTVLFAMEAIGVIMPLENNMKKPRLFVSNCGVLNCAMIPITISYVLMGLFGYIKYGAATQGSITLALPIQDKVAQAVRLLLTFAVFVTHSVHNYCNVNIIWHQLLAPRIQKRKVLWELMVRWCLVLIQYFFAVLVPNLDLFISLIGALSLSAIGLIFPAIIQLFTFWYDLKGFRFSFLLIKTILISILAIFGFIVGVSTSLKEIYAKFFA